MLLPYRWGYFEKGPGMKYEHKYADAIKLDNGNIFVLGNNIHQSPIKGKSSIHNLKLQQRNIAKK